MNKELKVLAVGDPAVAAYTDERFGVLEGYKDPVRFDVVPWNQYYNKMMDSFSGKEDYDIVMVAGHLWKYDFVQKGYIQSFEYDKADILPNIAAETEINGKTYLSPSFFDGHMIVYRKSVIREIFGKEFEDVITPAEYIDAAFKIHEYTGKPSVAMKADVSEILTDALPFMRMNGKDVYDKDSCEVTCTLPEVVDGLIEYCNLKKCAIEGTDNFGNEEIVDAIKTNKVPMAITWSGQLGYIYDDKCVDKDDLGFATLSTAWNVAWSFAINSKTSIKDRAEKFLEYLRSDKNDKIAGKVSGSPVIETNYHDDEKKYPWYKAQLKMVANAVTFPNMENAGDKNSVLYNEITEAFAGRKTPLQAMKDAETAIRLIK